MKKLYLIMGILSLIGCKASQSGTLSEKLEKIGYFDLIENEQKKKFVKEKIDIEFENDENPYIGKGWFIIPNDGYISSVYELEEYGNKSSTSDFKSFEIWGAGLLNGDFETALEEIKFVFEKNGLLFDWKDNNFNQSKDNHISHSVVINDKVYRMFDGDLTRDNYPDTIYQYITSLREILNDSISLQNKKFRVILLTQPETTNFILLSTSELEKFKNVLKNCKNKIED